MASALVVNTHGWYFLVEILKNLNLATLGPRQARIGPSLCSGVIVVLGLRPQIEIFSYLTYLSFKSSLGFIDPELLEHGALSC